MAQCNIYLICRGAMCVSVSVCVCAVSLLHSGHPRKDVLNQRLLREVTAVMTPSLQAMGTLNSMFICKKCSNIVVKLQYNYSIYIQSIYIDMAHKSGLLSPHQCSLSCIWSSAVGINKIILKGISSFVV